MRSRSSADSLLDLARRVWHVLDSSQKRECALVLLVSIVAACFTLIGVAGIAPFFAVLANPEIIARNAVLAWLHEALPIGSPDEFLVWLGVGFVILLSLSNLATFLALFCIGRFSQGVGASLHVLLFDEYLQRDLRFHARTNSAVLAAHVVQDVNRTVGGVIQSGLTLVASAVSVALITAAIVVVDPLIATVAVVLLGLSYTIVYTLARRRLMRNGATITEHWNMRVKVVAENLAAIKEVIAYRIRKDVTAQVTRQSSAIAEAQASTPAIAASPKYILECTIGAGLVASALWIHSRAGSGQWLTHLAFLSLAAYRLLPSLQQVYTALARIRSERVGFEGIADDLISARRRALRTQTGLSGGRPCRPLRRQIRVVEVTYRHSLKRTGGIENASLEIPAGALVGFVGPNGSGKTTLAELILGLLKPDSGYIEIDSVRLDDGNRDQWLVAVSHVPQHVVLFDATILQNIAFGVSPGAIDVDRVRDAARDARLEPLLQTLPDGLATRIGENGVRLSGGQRQRLGIARALYRRAALLVMDEATSALDGLAEAEIIGLLESLRGKRTTIVITHQPGLLRRCDLLFRLDDGQVVEKYTGAHLALRESTTFPLKEARK